MVIKPAKADELKSIVLNYLLGEATSVVKVRLQIECAELDASCNEIYKSIPVDLEAQDALLDAIFDSLNLSGPTREALFDKSNDLHEVLTHLYHDGHDHLGYLLRMLENTKPPSNWANIFIIGTLFSAGLGTFLQLQREYLESLINWVQVTFPTMMSWLGNTFSLLRNIPLLGIIYNSFGLLLNWYETFTNGTTTTTHKLGMLFFKTLTAGLTIAAYTLTYLAEGAMVVPAAVLFVVSSSIDVFKSLYIYAQNYKSLNHLTPPDPNTDDWKALSEYARASNLHERSLQSVWIRLGAAVLSTIAVGVWNFSPPSLVITITCLSIISLISLAKGALLANIDETYAHMLQKNIKVITSTGSQEVNGSASRNNRAAQLIDLQQGLVQKERDLSIRERAISDALSAVASRENSPQKPLHDDFFERSRRRPLHMRAQSLPFIAQRLQPPISPTQGSRMFSISESARGALADHDHSDDSDGEAASSIPQRHHSSP